jgi:hypothetical protein
MTYIVVVERLDVAANAAVVLKTAVRGASGVGTATRDLGHLSNKHDVKMTEIGTVNLAITSGSVR